MCPAALANIKYGAVIKKIFSMLHFPQAWIMVGILFLLGQLWETTTWLEIPPLWYLLLPAPAILMAAFLVKGLGDYLFTAGLLRTKYFLPLNRTLLAIEFFTLCTAAAFCICTLTYLAATAPFPLIDRQLDTFDKFLGFQWKSVASFSLANPWHDILQISYNSIISQNIFFALFFAFADRKKDLHEIFWIQIITLLVTIFIATFLPAAGPAAALGMEHFYNPVFKQSLSDAALIRAGINPDFSSHVPGGIVTFPSYHTAAAVIYIYAFRKEGWLGYGFLLLNIFLLLSVPAFGDHYLADMLAGILVALFGITVVRFMSSRDILPYALATSPSALDRAIDNR